jgi:hypothetical protein
MAELPTRAALQAMLERLPHEEENVETITRRIRFTTSEGRTVFAFARAGEKPLSFTGWEVRSDMTDEEDWDYFILGALNPDFTATRRRRRAQSRPRRARSPN